MAVIQPEQKKKSEVTFFDSRAVLSSYKATVIYSREQSQPETPQSHVAELITLHWLVTTQKKKNEKKKKNLL